MSMEEMYKQAKERGELKVLTPDYVEFKKKGDVILGRLKGISVVTSTSTGQSYNQYLVETDKGMGKFALGNATDNEIRPLLNNGKLYSFEFLGQEKLGGGKSVNKFNIVEVLEPAPPVTDNPEDVPFEGEGN